MARISLYYSLVKLHVLATFQKYAWSNIDQGKKLNDKAHLLVVYRYTRGSSQVWERFARLVVGQKGRKSRRLEGSLKLCRIFSCVCKWGVVEVIFLHLST